MHATSMLADLKQVSDPDRKLCKHVLQSIELLLIDTRVQSGAAGALEKKPRKILAKR